MQPGELATIFDAGLSVFPIYQTYVSRVSYFNYEQGVEDELQLSMLIENMVSKKTRPSTLQLISMLMGQILQTIYSIF
ncbi:hypothetical protein J6TS1_17890 [Siminovitchia terrae]|uniref:Rv2525c-like glycoside hydrolase-like domain-containing protein n=1 Tax=Siminovitchia terrae TaxID=1914933 RepID=A0ABQ4KW87_SIMTE|nr:hypothetical protein J22TS1_47500 [Siminovitchia terrae]GIN95919.1 hypothetical protein J6TS1_17890 [Siminovitchia terrae]